MEKTGEEFVEKTKVEYLSKSDQINGIPPPPFQKEYDKDKKLIDLPAPSELNIKETGLIEAIEQRYSVRDYSGEFLTLEELSFLLWCTQGVKEVRPPLLIFRNVPSAGARHAFETYLLINRVESLEPGLYRFLALEHKLILINKKKNICDDIEHACYNQKIIGMSAVTFIWTTVPYRMTWRYVERGYRYLFMDVGHVCQNLYLSVQAINCGTCAIAAYSDNDMNEILGVNGKDEFTIYIAPVGKRIKE